MENKFDYQNMLNKISSEKISKNKTPQFTDAQIDAWNNAIELCHHIVEGRRSKFEPSENSLHKHIVSNNEVAVCEHYEKPYDYCANYRMYKPDCSNCDFAN